MFPWYRTNIYHLEAYLNSPWKFPSMHSFFQHLAIYAGGFSDLQCLIPAIPQVFLGQFPMFEGFFPKKAHVFWSHFGEKHVLIPLFFSNSVLLGVRYLAFLCHMCDPVPQKHVLFPPTVWGLRWCNLFNSNDFPQLHQPPWKFPCMNGFPLTLISYIYIYIPYLYKPITI